MPLSKARNRERMRALRATNVQPKCKEAVQPTVPIYNPSKQYSLGDKVLVKPLYSKKLVEATIPELDADGHLIPDY